MTLHPSSIPLHPLPFFLLLLFFPFTTALAGRIERELTLGADGYVLPATLTLPREAVEAGRRVPCLILVHGSGPQDRDETLGPNKPFRDLAWGLAERGIATLRYDKRTKVYGADCVPAGRELDYDTETVDDAVAAVALAQTLPELAPDSIYLLGHSLGGTLAPRIAGRASGLAGIVILAGLARGMEDALVEQVEYIASTDSLASSEAMAPMVRAQIEQLKLQAANVKKVGTMAFDESIPLPLGLPRSYWQMAVDYKPVATASRLALPILVLQGERDYQVTMLDFGLWRLGLQYAPKASFKSYPTLNHLLQEGTGKAVPAEYTRPSVVPAYVVDDIALFLRTRRLQP